jgi:hypothetical protein
MHKCTEPFSSETKTILTYFPVPILPGKIQRKKLKEGIRSKPTGRTLKLDEIYRYVHSACPPLQPANAFKSVIWTRPLKVGGNRTFGHVYMRHLHYLRVSDLPRADIQTEQYKGSTSLKSKY